MRRILICLVLFTGCGQSVASKQAEAAAIYTASKAAFEALDADVRKNQADIKLCAPADRAELNLLLKPLQERRDKAESQMNAALAKMNSF